MRALKTRFSLVWWLQSLFPVIGRQGQADLYKSEVKVSFVMRTLSQNQNPNNQTTKRQNYILNGFVAFFYYI